MSDANRPAFDRTSVNDAGLVSQFVMMGRGLKVSPTRHAVALLAMALGVVIVATACGQIRLNSWNQPFYDALSRRDIPRFVVQLGTFAIIASALLVLNVAQRWLAEMLKLKLRQGLVQELVQNWLEPVRAFRIANAGAIGVNPDQRMHEDARHLTELSADLGIGLLQSSILLVSFIKILWGISSGFVFHVAGRALTIPGYMVWAAFVYAASASLASLWIGRSLIERNAERYEREAALRFSLVRVNEHIDAIAVARGEAAEARRVEADLAGVLLAMRNLLKGVVNLTWVTAGYGWFTFVAPILAGAPLYFGGTLTFGGLMMASGAFVQVQSSLRWFVDNASTLADWRATLHRVAGFRQALYAADVPDDADEQIRFGPAEPGRFILDHLQMVSPNGCSRLKEPYVEVQASERILVIEHAGTVPTLLFRTLAGLWTSGSGSVNRARDDSVLCMPRKFYAPPGSLREILAYPALVAGFPAEAFPQALERLGLARLVPMLDEVTRWDRVLSDAEQHALAFARAVIHAPRWLIIDHVFESLDEPTRRTVSDLLAEELAGSGLIYIGSAAARRDLFGRVLHLVRDPELTRSLPREGRRTARANG